jgi:hypothetical protein
LKYMFPQSLIKIKRELNCWKNKLTKAAKTSKEGDKRCLEDKPSVIANACEKKFSHSQKGIN